jgi:hypothetical protein
MNDDALHDFYHIAQWIKAVKEDMINLEHAVTTLYEELNREHNGTRPKNQYEKQPQGCL